MLHLNFLVHRSFFRYVLPIECIRYSYVSPFTNVIIPRKLRNTTRLPSIMMSLFLSLIDIISRRKAQCTIFFANTKTLVSVVSSRITDCHFTFSVTRDSKSRVRLQGVTLACILEPPRFPPYRRYSASSTHARRKSTLSVRISMLSSIYIPPLENRGNVDGHGVCMSAPSFPLHT